MPLGLCEDDPGGREGLSAVRELSPAAILEMTSDDQMTSRKDTKSNKGYHWSLCRKIPTNKRNGYGGINPMFIHTEHT